MSISDEAIKIADQNNDNVIKAYYDRATSAEKELKRIAMGKTIVGYIVMRTADGQYRGRPRWRGHPWYTKKTDAHVFRTEKSARVAVAQKTDTQGYINSGRSYYYSGRKYNYDNTGQEFIPVYADD